MVKNDLSGISSALWISFIFPFLYVISYFTEGAVVIRSSEYSLSSLSCTISKCNSHKNPHLNPDQSAIEFVGS